MISRKSNPQDFTCWVLARRRPRVPRPASSPPPARWRASVCRSSGRLCISTALPPLRRSGRRCSPRPSATVAAWHPGPAEPFRGKASVCLACGSRASVRIASYKRNLRRSASARLRPRPGNVLHSPVFAPFLRRQPARLRSLPRRITPRRSRHTQTA